MNIRAYIHLLFAAVLSQPSGSKQAESCTVRPHTGSDEPSVLEIRRRQSLGGRMPSEIPWQKGAPEGLDTEVQH